MKKQNSKDTLLYIVQYTHDDIFRDVFAFTELKSAELFIECKKNKHAYKIPQQLLNDIEIKIISVDSKCEINALKKVIEYEEKGINIYSATFTYEKPPVKFSRVLIKSCFQLLKFSDKFFEDIDMIVKTVEDACKEKTIFFAATESTKKEISNKIWNEIKKRKLFVKSKGAIELIKLVKKYPELLNKVNICSIN